MAELPLRADSALSPDDLIANCDDGTAPSVAALAAIEAAAANASRVDDFDNHIPALGDYVAPKKRQTDEQRNVEQLASILGRHGWEVRREVPVSAPDRKFRVDLLVTHPTLNGALGAIEVKGDLGHFRSYCNAVKQAEDYIGCQVLGTQERVAWGALWPHPTRHLSRREVYFSAEQQARRVTELPREYSYEGEVLSLPSPDPEELKQRFAGAEVGNWADIWAVHKYTSLHRKVLALCRLDRTWDEERRTWVSTPDGAELVYSIGHVVWSTKRGFVTGALSCLLGKRQVGGQRK